MYTNEGQYHGQKKKNPQKANNKPCMYTNEGQYHGQKKKNHKRTITNRACTSKKSNTMVKRKKKHKRANYEMQKNKHYRKLKIEQHEPQ